MHKPFIESPAEQARQPNRVADGPTRRAVGVSLEGIHATVAVPESPAKFWRNWRAYVGPALLVSVGYMDPGNWGTDLAAGAQHKYALLWVVAVASLMAIFLQVLSARLGIVTGKDLAQACRDWYPRWTRWPNWLMCEVAIGACDLAEVLGSAVALNLLFSHSAVLGRPHHGHRRIPIARPPAIWHPYHRGCRSRSGGHDRHLLLHRTVRPATNDAEFPRDGTRILTPSLRGAGMAYLAIGIIGATVMPHNLYLHSALVQSRKLQKNAHSIRGAVFYNTVDTTISLFIAFLINASILVLAAVVFFGKQSVTAADGQVITFGADSDWIRIAYLTLAPLLNTAAASTLFAVALLASGQSSTITGTLAGQVVMEGFMHWRLSPWVRRMITRSLAILPAVLIIGIRGDSSVNDLLTLSQVILALQLPFAIFPLLHFTSCRKYMGEWASGKFLLIVGWASAILITVMDVYGLPESLKSAWQVVIGS